MKISVSFNGRNGSLSTVFGFNLVKNVTFQAFTLFFSNIFKSEF